MFDTVAALASVTPDGYKEMGIPIRLRSEIARRVCHKICTPPGSTYAASTLPMPVCVDSAPPIPACTANTPPGPPSAPGPSPGPPPRSTPGPVDATSTIPSKQVKENGQQEDCKLPASVDHLAVCKVISEPMDGQHSAERAEAAEPGDKNTEDLQKVEAPTKFDKMGRSTSS